MLLIVKNASSGPLTTGLEISLQAGSNYRQQSPRNQLSYPLPSWTEIRRIYWRTRLQLHANFVISFQTKLD